MQLRVVWLNCGMYTETHRCPLKGDFPSPATHINPLLQPLNVKVRVMTAAPRAYACVHAHVPCACDWVCRVIDLLRGRSINVQCAVKAAYTPLSKVTGTAPVPWYTSSSDGLTGPWRRTSSLLSFFLLFSVHVNVEKHQTYNSLQKFCFWLSLYHL